MDLDKILGIVSALSASSKGVSQDEYGNQTKHILPMAMGVADTAMSFGDRQLQKEQAKLNIEQQKWQLDQAKQRSKFELEALQRASEHDAMVSQQNKVSVKDWQNKLVQEDKAEMIKRIQSGESLKDWQPKSDFYIPKADAKGNLIPTQTDFAKQYMELAKNNFDPSALKQEISATKETKKYGIPDAAIAGGVGLGTNVNPLQAAIQGPVAFVTTGWNPVKKIKENITSNFVKNPDGGWSFSPNQSIDELVRQGDIIYTSMQNKTLGADGKPLFSQKDLDSLNNARLQRLQREQVESEQLKLTVADAVAKQKLTPEAAQQIFKQHNEQSPYLPAGTALAKAAIMKAIENGDMMGGLTAIGSFMDELGKEKYAQSSYYEGMQQLERQQTYNTSPTQLTKPNKRLGLKEKNGYRKN